MASRADDSFHRRAVHLVGRFKLASDMSVLTEEDRMLATTISASVLRLLRAERCTTVNVSHSSRTIQREEDGETRQQLA